MAFDAFLQLYEPAANALVAGESMDSKFKNAIELSEFSFGAENTISIASGSGGAGAGKVTFKEFSCKKLTDTASSDIFKRLCNGTHYTARISIRKAGAAQAKSGDVYLMFEFNMLMVKSIDWSGSSGDDVPTESVTFMYGEMRITYQKQSVKGGLSGNFISQWSQLLNEPTFNTAVAGP